jgi:membrane carboxypeptidase/penicillin-binding protein PbpC
MGFTPSLVAGVWVGNSNNDEMKRGADGSVVAAPIWNKFMREALANSPTESFVSPEPTLTDKPVLNGSIAEGVKVKIDKLSGKLATNLTPESQVEEKTFRQVHCILHYINKDDPQGNTPPDLNDPQYQRWEAAVQDWAKRNNIISEEPPTEYDTNHNLADQPTIKIILPTTNQTITDRNFSAQVNASAPRGIKKVEYYLNNNLIQTVTQSPFSLNVYIADPALTSGFYTLKAIAYDDIDNTNSDNLDLNFQLPQINSSFSWQSPKNDVSINSKNFPYTLKADLIDTTNLESVYIYLKSADDQIDLINYARQFPSNKLISEWPNPPSPGNYQLYAKIINRDGFSYLIEPITINIK